MISKEYKMADYVKFKLLLSRELNNLNYRRLLVDLVKLNES